MIKLGLERQGEEFTGRENGRPIIIIIFFLMKKLELE